MRRHSLFLLSAKIFLIISAIGGLFMLSLFGCGAKKYHIDYSGKKDCFEGAKDTACAGENVTLYYGLIATDTDYAFYLDGERCNTGYDEEKGYIISFEMPEHDVTVDVTMKNSMEYIPETEIEPPEEKMLFEYYSATVATVGGDGYTEYVIYEHDEENCKLSVFEKQGDGEETRKDSLIPKDVLLRCNEVTEKYKMAEWNDMPDAGGITGAYYACRFISGGEYIRVTSEKMPENGAEAFSEVKKALLSK